ncbi:MAG: hypothetical protein ACRCV5_16200 [Afipia sp.]
MDWMHGGEGAFGSCSDDGLPEFYGAWSERQGKWKWDTWTGARKIAHGWCASLDEAKAAAMQSAHIE